MLMTLRRTVAAAAALAVVGALLLSYSSAHAVPSFARQTGLACEACHTVFPELTPFGRKFKLNAYLVDNLPQVKGLTPDNKEALALNWMPPFSVQFIASYTKLKTAQPDPNGGVSQNGSVQFPEAFSLFYAGKIAPKVGGFIQVTYDNQDNTVGWDNTDIRFADQATLKNNPLTYGLTFNNAPTVQDPWNSTPAWKYPFSQTSSLMPSPITATQLDGLGNDKVAGLGAYVYWNNLVYAELSAYAPAPHGLGGNPLNSAFPDASVHGIAPYWRVAIEPQWGRHSLSFGAYGISDQLTPGGTNVTVGPYNKYRDTAIDAQYQFIGDEHIFSAETTYIYEKQTLNAAAAADPSLDPSQTLKQFRLGGSYFYERKFGGSLGYFWLNGTSNATYSAGSANNSPNSSGWSLELDYLPWQNVKLALQYVAFTKFNGASSNFDGTGRNASDNNTLYIFAWLAF
jgi:hypothetical protein